ncbi:MAG: flagellin [Methanoregula sp.]|nr:flagellin [Methanoregula sp.]
MKRSLFDDTGFTGLEAAIVLIAFVVVAAVFSYVVLGAGFFTTQTAQATVHTGVAQASSSVEIVGNVMGIAVDTSPTRLTFINTSVALTAGGTPMDLSQMVISYSDSNGGRVANVPNATSSITDCTTNNILTTSTDDIHWCVSQKINDQNPSNPNNLLEPNEIWTISIGMPSSASINQKITVSLQPAVGAVITLSRTIPGALSKVQAVY